MLWLNKFRKHEDQGRRQEPAVTSRSVAIYAKLLGVSPHPDAAAYRRDFGSGSPKNADGIPLAFEEQVESVAQIIATSYEERYDDIKAQMKSRGMTFWGTMPDDQGDSIMVNFAALAAAPIVSSVTDEPELVPFGIAALHWLLASDESEWVYSHLVEATGAYHSCQALRDELTPGYADDYDDLRDMLREALRQYIHRHV